MVGGTNGNTCWSGWRSPATYPNAARDCFDEGTHVCSYEEFYHAWQGGTNPAFLSNDWIGNIVGDDAVLCVNNTTTVTNFEGTCAKNDSHWYRCCTGRR